MPIPAVGKPHGNLNRQYFAACVGAVFTPKSDTIDKIVAEGLGFDGHAAVSIGSYCRTVLLYGAKPNFS